MKLIIKGVNYNDKYFSVIIGNRKTYFYLTSRLNKIFLNSLRKGLLVDFEIGKNKRRINAKICYQVAYFNKITDLKTKRDLYNHSKLKSDMLKFLEKNEHYLFIDFEMTLPKYRQKNFKVEILQYGYLLVNKKGETIIENDNYLKTIIQYPPSSRTLRFLSIDKDEYINNHILFKDFYLELKEILETYNPKIVVWGKNDILSLDIAYDIHRLAPITKREDFVDLLKLHRDYFNLANDLGLFKAYETYSLKREEQVHDATYDAKVTKKVFDSFIAYSKNEVYNK